MLECYKVSNFKHMAFSTKILSRVFKALGNQKRMDIIKIINKKPLSVIDISDRLNISFKTASFHLLKMEREGLVENQKDGKFVYYKPTDKFRGSGVFRQIIESG